MKRKRLSIIRILFYMIILTVIGAVLFYEEELIVR